MGSGYSVVTLRRMTVVNGFHFTQYLCVRYISNFANYEISSRVVTRMDELGITKLTDIQEKAQIFSVHVVESL